MLGNLGHTFQRVSNGELSCKQLDKNYTKIQMIGKGKYGTVYKAKNHCSSEIVALKKINTDKETSGFPKTALREIQILRSLKHENIVELKEVVTQHNTTYLVLEYMEHDLQSVMQQKISFTPAQLRYVMFQVLQGLSYLQSHNIYHRDLKPNNILYNNGGRIKICDFGMASVYNRRVPQTRRVQIPQYRAPEIHLGQHYNCQVDVWSAGILFIELFVRQSPFMLAQTENQCFQTITKLCGSPDEDNWSGVTALPNFHQLVKEKQNRTLRQYLTNQPQWSPLLVDLVDKMLTLCPNKRITASEALEHEFFKGKVIVEMPKFQLECNGRLMSQKIEQPPQKKVKKQENDHSHYQIIVLTGNKKVDFIAKVN